MNEQTPSIPVSVATGILVLAALHLIMQGLTRSEHTKLRWLRIYGLALAALLFATMVTLWLPLRDERLQIYMFATIALLPIYIFAFVRCRKITPPRSSTDDAKPGPP